MMLIAKDTLSAQAAHEQAGFTLRDAALRAQIGERYMRQTEEPRRTWQSQGALAGEGIEDEP